MKLPLKGIKLDGSDILPIAVAVMTVTQLLQFCAVVGLSGSYKRLAEEPGITLVQQTDGGAFIARSEARNHREPEVVRELVKTWVTFTFNWKGTLPSPDGKTQVRDPGIPVADGRVPTVAWQASFLLPDATREPFLNRLAKDWVPTGLFSGSTNTVLTIEELSEPELVDQEAGLWRVNLVSSVNYLERDNPVGESRAYNVYFLLRAVDPPAHPLNADASTYQKIVYQLRQRGLQITDIRPLEISP